MSIIEVKNLVKEFGKEKKSIAVNDISFSINEGEIVAFIGPNGAGKSTTIKILTGILHPTSGDATVCGYTPWKDRTKVTYNIGCLFGQKSQLNQNLKVIDSYMLLGAIYDIPKKELFERINEFTTYFDIKNLINKPANSLSLGQRMICEIVGSILHKPKVLFLDEPTIGLDIVTKQQVRDLILKLNKQYGMTVILTSHDIGDVEYLCEKIMIINYGQIVLNENIDKLRDSILTKMIINVTFDKQLEEGFSKCIGNAKVLSMKNNSCSLEFDTKTISINDLVSNLSKYSKILRFDCSSTNLETIIYDNFKQMKGAKI